MKLNILGTNVNFGENPSKWGKTLGVYDVAKAATKTYDKNIKPTVTNVNNILNNIMDGGMKSPVPKGNAIKNAATGFIKNMENLGTQVSNDWNTVQQQNKPISSLLTTMNKGQQPTDMVSKMFANLDKPTQIQKKIIPQQTPGLSWNNTNNGNDVMDYVNSFMGIKPTNISTNTPGLTFNNKGPAILGAMPQPSPSPTPIPEPTPIPGMGSPYQNEYTNSFIKKVISPIATKYGVNPAIAAAQFANEGRLAGVGARFNNFFNLGITDSMVESGDYSNAPRFKTPEAGVEAYMRFITGQADDSFYANGVDNKNGKLGKKQFAEIFAKYKNDPVTFLKMIGPTYASTGEAYANTVMNTPEWRENFINA